MESVIWILNDCKLLSMTDSSNVAIHVEFIPSSVITWCQITFCKDNFSMIHFFVVFWIFAFSVSWLWAVWMDSQFSAQLDRTTSPSHTVSLLRALWLDCWLLRSLLMLCWFAERLKKRSKWKESENWKLWNLWRMEITYYLNVPKKFRTICV